ncbi:uncharacterized protein K441DRAFT_555503, partial [Cenococcum geophilum 1.58]|uniref:uncharacterized protein n=1 Tax=Cenococcum geophilum 1.58 TaxID=794803 RepID=UPI00358EA698
PIYNLLRKELKILWEYLNRSLEKGKLLLGALILFIPKPDRTIRLCVNYCGLNKIIIKNRYLLLLVSKMLD